MISFAPGEEFSINVYPGSDWTSSDSVSVEVISPGLAAGNPPSGPRTLKWRDVSHALKTQFGLNQQQLSTMTSGLGSGKVLKFQFKCRRSKLVAAGFLGS